MIIDKEKLRKAVNKLFNKKLKVIPKPEEGSRSVIMPPNKNEATIIQGSGNINLVCGNCGASLAKGVEENQIKNVVLYCNQCNSYNEVS